MTVKEDVALMQEDILYLKGRVETISSLCALLIATHPRGGKIVEVFKARASEIERLEHPTASLKAYADGLARLACELNIDDILYSFQEDELKLFPIPQSGGH
ncbi:MAG: hypothetical protein ACYCR3_11485 [Acidithiobacillus sp.]